MKGSVPASTRPSWHALPTHWPSSAAGSSARAFRSVADPAPRPRLGRALLLFAGISTLGWPFSMLVGALTTSVPTPGSVLVVSVGALCSSVVAGALLASGLLVADLMARQPQERTAAEVAAAAVEASAALDAAMEAAE